MAIVPFPFPAARADAAFAPACLPARLTSGTLARGAEARARKGEGQGGGGWAGGC